MCIHVSAHVPARKPAPMSVLVSVPVSAFAWPMNSIPRVSFHDPPHPPPLSPPQPPSTKNKSALRDLYPPCMYYMRMSILLVYPARVPAQKCAHCDSAVTCVYVLACVFIDT